MDDLPTYLNDHYAGSVAAVQLVEHLGRKCEEKRSLFDALHADLIADQEVLAELVQRTGSKSVVRRAAAWLLEKVSRVKFKAGGEDFGELGLFEALEVLALGITGKRLLWSALSRSLKDPVFLHGIDLGKLEQRAAEQFNRVETLRLECARKLFRDVGLPGPAGP